jgi:hypothetical protein
MTLTHNFVASGPTPIPPGLVVSGDFYDLKNRLFSKVDINLENTSQVIYRYTIVILRDGVSHEYDATTSLSKDSTYPTKNKLEIDIVHSSSPRDGVVDKTIEYYFSNLLSYSILHKLDIKEVVNSVTKTYNLTHTQNFRYYTTPVTLTNFTFTRGDTTDDHFQNNDTIKISGLILDHGSNNPIDQTIPETRTILPQGIVIQPILVTIQEDVVSSGSSIEYIEYETAYVPSGNYTLENVQLTTGKIYKINVTASWLLGYSTDIASTQKLSVFNRPAVANVAIADLYEYNVNADVMTITIDPLVSASFNLASKLWFEFYNLSNTLVAKAGGSSGISINTGSNVYTIKLSNIVVESNGGLLNDTNYKVKALVQYTTGQYRRSDLSPDNVNFTKSIPKIVGRTINSLYTSDPTKNILTIDVEEQAYQLYAPNITNGIRFNFYDESVNTTTPVASTSYYTFENSEGGGNVTYPIKLSEVTPGVLLNDKDYRIKAEVKLVKHNGDTENRLSELSSATGSIPDKVNFTKSLPEIVGHTINPLYTSDPLEKILDIEVQEQEYFLVAPNVASGIKFHFYDADDTETIVASTISYTFVNSEGEGNVTYPILLSEVTRVLPDGDYLVNDKNYRIKAEVTLVKHSGTSELRLSELSSVTESIPDQVNFSESFPEIVNHTINSLYTSNPLEKILDIGVKKQAYFLVAPNVASGIKFHFYDESSTTIPVASTSSYTFVNSAGTGNVTYPILLSEVTPGVLVNDKDYRIQAEVTLEPHHGGTETRPSAFSSLTTSIPDKVNFSIKTPFINTITSYDFQVEGDDSADPVIANVVVRKELYELVAPNVSDGVDPNLTDGIKFLIYDSDETTLVGSTKFYLFQNSSANPTTEYSILLSHVTIESGHDPLENGRTYRVKAQVTIIPHAGSPPELRVSAEFKDLKGSQDAVSLSSVTISNSWALATNNNPSTSGLTAAEFAASPNVGISGFFTKTPQFNGGSTINHLDIATTKFRIEYQVDNGLWTDVQKAVLLPKLSTDASLGAAAIRINAVTPETSSGDGKFNNVIGSGPGQLQPEMIFFIPQQQVTGTNAFTESNLVKVRISIIDPTNMWGSANGGTTDPRESNSIQLINRINNYGFALGQSSEPYNTLSQEDYLFLNIPVDWKSIHAHSVVVGYKYVSGDDYSYQTFTYDPTTTISFEVDPIDGRTTLYYSVAYLVKNVNISPTATTQGLTIEDSVPIKFFPSSSDYSITNTSYTTFNTGGKSSIKFDLAFTAASTSKIGGINVYFTSPSSTQQPNQGSGIDKTRIATFTASQAGINKTIQLLHVGSTINYATTLNNIPLNRIDASGAPIDVTNDFSLPWQDFDFANISFEAFRDRRVTTTGASFGTINYVESGSSDFNRTIWNVPVMNSPRWNGPITLVGGVRNSSNATKLSWMQVHNMNDVDFTYDFTMMKDDNSASLIHDYTGSAALVESEQILTIDTNANAKYNITLASVFDPGTTGSMREVSAHPDTIEFHTIHVDVSDIDISVQNPSNTTKVNLSFNDAVVSGNTLTTAGAIESATFDSNIAEQHVMFTSTDPTMALTRLVPTNNVIERIVPPATTKEYLLPIGSILGQNFSFFMRLKAFIKYKVTKYTNATPTTPTTEVLTTSSVEIADQTATDDDSQYIVSSIPIIGTTFTITPDPVNGNPTLNFLLDANGLEVEGFTSVVVIIGQDGTESKPDGEAVVLVFPDTGATSDYSNEVAGSGAVSLDPRLTAGESFTATPTTITGAVHGSHTGDYTLTIGDVNDTTGRFNNSTLKMPASSDSGFTDGATLNLWILATTRRGTNFSSLTATYTPPVVISNLSISAIGDDFFANFDVTST